MLTWPDGVLPRPAPPPPRPPRGGLPPPPRGGPVFEAARGGMI